MIGKILAIVFIACFGFTNVQAQSYEDARCKCVCTILNGTHSYKQLYIANVPANDDCDGVSVPVVENNSTRELCPKCECKYESRNTTVIKVVVIIVIWIISLLVIYMLFLICLDPLLNKRAKSSYVEHTNEDTNDWIRAAQDWVVWRRIVALTKNIMSARADRIRRKQRTISVFASDGSSQWQCIESGWPSTGQMETTSPRTA